MDQFTLVFSLVLACAQVVSLPHASLSSDLDLPVGCQVLSIVEDGTEIATDCRMAAFGEYLPTHRPTESLPIVLAGDDHDDAVETSSDLGISACTALKNDSLNGAIAVVRRGKCAFQDKLLNVAAAGGRGMILVNSDDLLVELGALEHKQILATAASISRYDGDRLIALIQNGAPRREVPQARLFSNATRYRQAWHRINYLMMINAPLVAYETFMDVLPAALSSVDTLLQWLAEPGDELDFNSIPHNEREDLIALLSNCASHFPLKWDFTADAAFHAAIGAAVIAEGPVAIEPELRQQLRYDAATHMMRSGYFHQASRALISIDSTAARCQLAFIQFLQGDVADAISSTRSCADENGVITNSVPQLEVPHETFLRLTALDMSDDDQACVYQAILDNSDVKKQAGSRHDTNTCCTSRIPAHNAGRVSSMHTFQSAFVEELFHAFTVMGVFMDELGAFNESLLYFRYSTRLCEDWSLSTEMRASLAVPIVFQDVEEITSFVDQFRAKIDDLVAHRMEVDRVIATASAPDTLTSIQAMPTGAGYLQYTITPPTMFIGYQGVDVRPLQQMVYACHAVLYPSLVSDFEVVPGNTQDPLSSPPKRRIAFISSWFRNHSVGKLMLGIVERLDRSRFHVLVYRVVHFLAHPDELTVAFKAAADSYTELPVKQDQAVDFLRSEALDVVLYPELGMDAWTVFLSHHRLAPVQCVFWGHPITTGNPNIDFFISSEFFISDFFDYNEPLKEPSDAAVSPQPFLGGDTPGWPGMYHGSSFSEQVVLFRGLSTFFTQPKPFQRDSPITRSMLYLPETQRLYVCPQTLMKMHPAFDHVLLGILTADPMATIVLLASSTQLVWKERLRQRFRRSFGQHHRRVFFSATLPYREFMALLATADVMLDPFPFGGGVTTLDALAVGTPVVTLPAAQTVVQLAAGFLRYMNVTDTIVASTSEYIAMALRVAQDEAFRSRLRDRIQSQRHAIYEDASTLEDWNTFLSTVSAVESTDSPPSSRSHS